MTEWRGREDGPRWGAPSRVHRNHNLSLSICLGLRFGRLLGRERPPSEDTSSPSSLFPRQRNGVQVGPPTATDARWRWSPMTTSDCERRAQRGPAALPKPTRARLLQKVARACSGVTTTDAARGHAARAERASARAFKNPPECAGAVLRGARYPPEVACTRPMTVCRSARFHAQRPPQSPPNPSSGTEVGTSTPENRPERGTRMTNDDDDSPRAAQALALAHAETQRFPRHEPSSWLRQTAQSAALRISASGPYPAADFWIVPLVPLWPPPSDERPRPAFPLVGGILCLVRSKGFAPQPSDP